MPGQPPPDVTLRDLHAASDGALLQRFYDEILTPYFAPDELVPLDALEGALHPESQETDIVVALDGSGTVIGGAVGDWDGDARVYLLSYLAVGSVDRSKGIGTLLMGRVRSWWEGRGACATLAEVDDPRHHEVSAYGDPEARLRFYERGGARVLDTPYTQPEVRPGTGRRAGMLLITLFVGPDARDGDGMRPDVLRRFLANYLAAAEQVPADRLEAAVDALAPALAGARSVPILPMSRYLDI